MPIESSFFSKTESEMTQEEVIRKRILLKEQVSILYKSKLSLRCPVCNGSFFITHVYKCFDCGLFFCKQCAKEHFFPEEKINKKLEN